MKPEDFNRKLQEIRASQSRVVITTLNAKTMKEDKRNRPASPERRQKIKEAKTRTKAKPQELEQAVIAAQQAQQQAQVLIDELTALKRQASTQEPKQSTFGRVLGYFRRLLAKSSK